MYFKGENFPQIGLKFDFQGEICCGLAYQIQKNKKNFLNALWKYLWKKIPDFHKPTKSAENAPMTKEHCMIHVVIVEICLSYNSTLFCHSFPLTLSIIV